MTPDISIITPVYKAERYLTRCIESLLAQTHTNFELILVDDGSPDSSGAICDRYASKDSRIKVIHKENGGVSSARQCGIDNATGTYTIHVDPDDWADPTMLERLYNKAIAADADIVICDYYSHRKGKTRRISQHPASVGSKALLRQYLRQELHGSLCNKLIKRELYTRYNVSFPKEITRWEDLYVVCTILTHSVKVAYLAEAFYHYDQSINNNSIARKRDIKGLYSQMLFVKHFQSTLPQDEFSEELYRLKAATKELAYNSGAMPPQEVLALYSEINGKYIRRSANGTTRQQCLSLFLSGKYTYSKAKRMRRLIDLIGRIRKILPSPHGTEGTGGTQIQQN